MFSRKGEKNVKNTPSVAWMTGKHFWHRTCRALSVCRAPLRDRQPLTLLTRSQPSYTLFLREFLWALWHAFPRLDPKHEARPLSTALPHLFGAPPGGEGTAGRLEQEKPKECTDAPETLHEVTPRTWGHFPRAQGQAKWRETQCKLSASPLCRAETRVTRLKVLYVFSHLVLGRQTCLLKPRADVHDTIGLDTFSPTAKIQSPTVSP